MKRFYILLLGLFISSFSYLYSQNVGIKTNALYLATTTPNLGLEFKLGKKFTLSTSLGYNPFQFSGKYTVQGDKTNPRLKHWLVSPELKYWFCRSFERSYIGIHGLYSDFNIGGIPFIKQIEFTRYKGRAYGGGIAYGYHWSLGNRWGLDLSLGVGYLRMEYDQFECVECGDHIGKYQRNYFGPTKAELSFVYFIR